MDINELLALAITQQASDLHLSTGVPPILRIDGELKPCSLPALIETEILSYSKTFLTPQQNDIFITKKQVDFAFGLENSFRCRANLFCHQRGVSLAIRLIPPEIPNLNTLATATTLKKIIGADNGLIIITGATGSGKSTTLASIIDYINQTQQLHIITIEDPIEFIYQNKNCLLEQREILQHCRSFHETLTASLRQDPDILVIGELRDLETIRLALTAAETGHLVFASLHTSSAAKAIHRIIDVFPAEEKTLIRSLLASCLTAVIAQRLLKKIPHGRIAVQEIMCNTLAIQNLIKEDKIAHIYSIMQTGQQYGMQTLEQHLSSLLNQGMITRDEALSVANYKDLIT